MNTRYTTVNLDVSQQGSIPSITLSQYDLGVGLSFYIMDGGMPYSEFAETDTVVLSGTKPSGVGFTIPAYYKSENLCSFRTTQAMTTEAGTVTCEITITKVNNISVSTANFFVEVEASAHAHEVVDEDIEDFGLIADQVGEYKVAAVRAAQQAAQSATDAAASAGSAEESMEAAQSAASSAIAAKDDIQEYIDDSEAWAKGTRGGEAVPSTDETYENNAKYYAEQSSQASMDAGVSATEAAASAQAAAASVVGAVKYTAQTLTTEQKAQARTNIGAASPSDIPSGTVRYDTSQSLTDAQKTQAKNNIGVPAIDATLAVTGAAADAKKVGDELTALKGDLSDVEERIDDIDVLSIDAKNAFLTCLRHLAWSDATMWEMCYNNLYKALFGVNPGSTQNLYMESGDIDSATGADISRIDRIRTKGYIPVSGTISITDCPFDSGWAVDSSLDVRYIVRCFDSSKTYLGTLQVDGDGLIARDVNEVPLLTNTAYIRLVMQSNLNDFSDFAQRSTDTISINYVRYSVAEETAESLYMESGDIDSATGDNITRLDRIRTKGYISVSETISIVGCPFDSDWAVSNNLDVRYIVRCYDNSKTYLGTLEIDGSGLIASNINNVALLTNTVYIRLVMQSNLNDFSDFAQRSINTFSVNHVSYNVTEDTAQSLYMESGDIDATTGTNVSKIERIRTKGYIQASGTISIVGCPFDSGWAVSNNLDVRYIVRCFDTSKTYLGTLQVDGDGLIARDVNEVALPTNTAYIRLVMQSNLSNFSDFAQRSINTFSVNNIIYRVVEETPEVLPMESGDIDSATGTNVSKIERIRTKGYIQASGTISIVGCPFDSGWAVSNNLDVRYIVRCFDSNKSYLGTLQVDGGLIARDINEVALPTNTAYIRLVMQSNLNDFSDFAQLSVNTFIVNDAIYRVTG